MVARPNPLTPFLDRQGIVILDGGLATELEAHGHDLSDALWSARLLRDDPDAIRDVHIAYLQAGADCLITASYQATLPGFLALGVTEAEASELLRLSVSLAGDARDTFWNEPANRMGRLRPLVAASIGPYGAFLANGSEYTGDYALDERGLLAFHRRRWEILAATPADLLAGETIPSFPEARALATLAAARPEMPFWVSFACRDGRHIADGTPLRDCVRWLEEHAAPVAVGINCTPPRFIPALIDEIHAVSTTPIVVYPNSGERYDATDNSWHGERDPNEFGTLSREWRKAGAALVGGCCRTTPAHIRQIRDRVPAHRTPPKTV